MPCNTSRPRMTLLVIHRACNSHPPGHVGFRRWSGHPDLLRKEEVERDLDEEIRFHIDREIAEHIASGMDPHEARGKTMVELGGSGRTEERVRAVRVDPVRAFRTE